MLVRVAPFEAPITAGVYFLLIGTAVKVGHSVNMRKRIMGLRSQQASRCVLAAYIEAEHPIVLERQFHLMFARDHLHDEWFRWTKALQDYVASFPSAKLNLTGLSVSPSRRAPELRARDIQW